MRFALPSADLIREQRSRDWTRTHPLLLGEQRSLSGALLDYIEGVGLYADHLVQQVRDQINAIAVAQRVITAGESLFDPYGRILPQCLREFCPGYTDVFRDVAPENSVASHEVLPASANQLHDATLPPPLNMVSHRPNRPSFRIHSTQGAELYVNSGGYQLFNSRENWFWPSGSSRPFSKRVTSGAKLPIADHIVIIQDRFGGDNFAHFLFDWITRLGLFLESGLAPANDCVFVMGGVPNQFQSILLRAVSDVYGVERGQFFFPEDGLVLRTEGHVYWFSDQVETYVHPAQMAHPRSIEVIRRLAAKIPIEPGPFERIYISRGDTGRRRVANEAELWNKLSGYGFEMIRLADHPLEQQISLIRGAKCIVAAHGMGLAHVSLHLGAPSLVELHNPRIGTDAFGLMARAMGCHYEFVIGTETGNEFDDYAIPPGAMTALFARVGLLKQPDRRPNLVPASSTFAGNWSPGAQEEELARISYDVPELFIGNAVMRHVRRNPAVRSESNCGNWWGIPIEPSRIYTATCWVWIPTEFDGREVLLSLGEWGHQQWVFADLAKRNVWQRLRTTVTAPGDVNQCAIVIRLDAGDGSVVYSTCWQLERGPEPTDYIATP